MRGTPSTDANDVAVAVAVPRAVPDAGAAAAAADGTGNDEVELRSVFIVRPCRGANEAAWAGAGAGPSEGDPAEVRPLGDADLLRMLRWYPPPVAELERPVLPTPMPTPEKKDMTLVCEAERCSKPLSKGSDTAAAADAR